METILIHPTTAFLTQAADNKRKIALKKMAIEIVDGKTTEATTMELDAEGGASFEQLQDLVRKEVQK